MKPFPRIVLVALTVLVAVPFVFSTSWSGIRLPDAHPGRTPGDNIGQRGNTPPTVRITCPEPTPLAAIKTLPSIQILWDGSDPDGATQEPVEYKYILLGPGSEFPAPLAVSNPDSLRRYYANHPLGPWAGWDSTGTDTTRVYFTNLIPNEEFVFAVIAFDEAGAYSPIFSLSSNMLRLDVTFDGFLGPRITMIGPGLHYQYPTGGYCPCQSAEVPTDVEENRLVKFQWFADPDGLCGSANIRSYRWTLDIADVSDETPRTDEATDVQHWSQKSLTTTSATIGPFANGQMHRFYIEAEDDAGMKSLGIILFTVVPETNQAPDCVNAGAQPSQIWPPNQRFVPVNIRVGDPDGDPVAVTVTRVTQDEPLEDGGGCHHDGAMDIETGAAGDLQDAANSEDRDLDLEKGGHGHGHGRDDCADAIIDPNGRVSVRAERSGRGNGRVYTIWFSASDGQGNSCDGSVHVCVPHDQGHPACVDDGGKFNSLGPCPGGRGPHREDVSPAVVALAPMTRTGNTLSVRYSLPTASAVTVGMYDVAGRRVATIENGAQVAGAHEVTWNTSSLAHGMYFCRLQAGQVIMSRSLLILR